MLICWPQNLLKEDNVCRYTIGTKLCDEREAKSLQLHQLINLVKPEPNPL